MSLTVFADKLKIGKEKILIYLTAVDYKCFTGSKMLHVLRIKTQNTQFKMSETV